MFFILVLCEDPHSAPFSWLSSSSVLVEGQRKASTESHKRTKMDQDRSSLIHISLLSPMKPSCSLSEGPFLVSDGAGANMSSHHNLSSGSVLEISISLLCKVDDIN